MKPLRKIDFAYPFNDFDPLSPKIAEGVVLPRLRVGSWLAWRNMGAYTITCSSEFNGFPKARVHPVARAALRGAWVRPSSEDP